MANYTDHFFYVSRISVVMASFVICMAGVVWLVRAVRDHRFDIPKANHELLIRLGGSISDLCSSQAESNRLHQQELDYRIDLMQTLHQVVKELKMNSEELKNYGRRCNDIHEYLKRANSRGGVTDI